MIPRETSPGRLAVNLTLDRAAYGLLQTHAANRRSYGQFISKVILDYVAREESQDLRRRVERLEKRLAAGSSTDVA